jgi:PPM family protein phosphatase
MVLQVMPYKVVAFGLSDIGLVRQNNEDVWAELPEEKFYVLADGMGGHQAGEVAAREAVNSLCAIMKKSLKSQKTKISLEEMNKIIANAIEQVNIAIYKMGRTEADLRGMGTTICCLLFYEEGIIYGNVGDSRIYRLREKQLIQLTKDHSLLRELLELGQISEQQATDFLYKNIITKAIGTEAKVEPSLYQSPVKKDDVYLMCSDGLSDLLNLKDIETTLNAFSSPQDAVKELIAKANQLGGHDNITVVIAKVQENDEEKDLSR